MREWFARADADGSGTLDLAEVTAFLATLAEVRVVVEAPWLSCTSKCQWLRVPPRLNNHTVQVRPGLLGPTPPPADAVFEELQDIDRCGPCWRPL
eukprot:COSAG01_NODE_11211_length_1981_cov_1.542508_3_plen_95_part_00